MNEEERESSKNMRRLGPAFAFLKPYKLQVIVASVALIVTASATLSLGQGIRLVIDSGFASGEIAMLTQSLMLFVTFIGILTAGTFVRFYFVSWVGERVSADIRLAVFDHLIHMHPGYFEDNAPSEIQSRITTDTTLLQTVIGSSVSIALRNILMFFGGMVLLFLTNAKLSLIVLASVPFVVLPVIFFGRRVRTLSRSSQDRLADVGSHAGESFRYIKVVQAFNHQDADIRSFASRVEEVLRVSLQRVWLRSVLIAVVMLLVFGAIAMLLWVGGQDVLAGNTSPGDLAAFIFYAFIVAGSVGAISEVWSDLQRAAGATERLIEILQSPWAIVDGPGQDQSAADYQPGLRLDSVNFTYPSRPEQAVLRDVSFAIAPGEMVALVGPSGAGKSTLFDLLQRFYDPDSGVIALGDDDIRSLKLHKLRGTFGFVPQDPVLFAGSLRENLTYAKTDATDEEIATALRGANAGDFIAALPKGLATTVGEGGIGLSGGQRQRLAIARALLLKPSFLLLDEATSALDAESEQYIRQSVEALKGDMTILVIAHRLSTVRQADRILVLQEGSLIASGSHDELVASNPLYARFANIQFAT
ncbi:MAG: ABC transporter transmembrane domain-containing protein [Pseudomonadales bacterium]|jgi:ATP-binding cassette subfamily B protein|tara:strand:- start:53 stop:1816 length:1764 start_codon:yes stop_codon:yes gene_type:complete